MVGEILSAASLVKDIGVTISKSIPDAVEKWKFKKFFGKYALSEDKIAAVIDPYEHRMARPTVQRGDYRYIKYFKSGRPPLKIMGEDKVFGECSIRVTNFVTSTFSKFLPQKRTIRIKTDEEVFNEWDSTFICFGSSDSNEKTYEIEQLSEYNLHIYKTSPNTGSRCFEVDGKIFDITSDYDIAIITRTTNPFHSKHYLFICAGLGGWGTSGAAYYLLNEWKQLNKRFKKNPNFCLVLEVKYGQDQSAREVFEYCS